MAIRWNGVQGWTGAGRAVGTATRVHLIGIGLGLLTEERRFSAGKPRPTTPLDAIKFICKDLWILVFRKQIDNLKTNHRGIFVLTDNRFQPLSRMSVDRRAGPKAAEEAVARAQTVRTIAFAAHK